MPFPLRELLTGLPMPQRPFSLKTKISLSFFLASVLLYHVAFSRPVVHAIIHGAIPDAVELSFEVKRASLLFGFEFDSVIMKDRISGDPIFRADQVRFKWFLPGFLAGQIGIREFGLTNPTISLIRRNGRWNTEALSSGKKKEPEPPSSREAIELFLPVRLYGAVHIEGLRFLVEDYRPTSTARLDVADVDIHFGLITKTFHHIPLNLSAVDLVDSVFVALNPLRPFRFEYVESDRFAGRPLLVLKMFRESESGRTMFVTRMNADTRDLALTAPGGLQLPLNMAFEYDIYYDPVKEMVVVRDLRLTSGADLWLSLTGSFSRDTEGYHTVDLKMRESNIRLDPINPLLTRITNGALQGNGSLSLFPLTLSGRLDRLRAEVGLVASGLSLRTGGSLHSVPRAAIDLRATVDLYALGLLNPPASYSPDRSLAYGVVQEATIDRLDITYNGATLRGSGSLRPDRGIDLNLNLAGFDLAPYTAPAFFGTGGAALHARSGTDFRAIGIDGTVTLDGARYRIDRSLSAAQNLRLDTDLTVRLENETTLDVRRAALNDYDLTGNRLATIRMGGQFAFGKTSSYSVNLQSLDLDYAKLHPTLPGSLRANLAAAHSYLEKGVQLAGRANLLLDRDRQTTIQGELNLVLPSISRDGMNLRADLSMTSDEMHFRDVQLSGLRGALNARLTGQLAGLKGSLKPGLDFRLNLSRKGMLPVHENVTLDGSLDLSASLRPEKIDGSIDIHRFNLIYSTAGCRSQAESRCTRYHLEDLNFTLPFHHDMHASPLRYQEILNPDLIERFPDRPNLTLRALWSNRSPDGLEVSPGFYYLGAPSPQAAPAIESNLRYYKNILEGRQFRLATYRLLRKGDSAGEYVSNGTLEIRNLFFNMADLNPANMEYGAHLNIHDLNIEPYFPRAGSSYDGIVSAAAQVRGENLSDPIRNVDARLAVYRISKDFTGLAVRIMVPSPLLAQLVNNTLEIPSLSAELRGGLVYTIIQVRSPGVFAFSKLIRPKEETIRQERIPLAEFLARTRKETGEF